MLLEVKTRHSDLKTWQKQLFKNLHKWIIKGIDNDWQYLGLHLVQFENTCFADGRCFFDYNEISEKDLKNKLTF